MIYKIQLSTKEHINISEAEYDKFKSNLDKSFIEFEQGIINPSFVVSITIDHEATKDEIKELKMAQNFKEITAPVESTQPIKELLNKYKPSL